jgi:inosine-uridine nucleoside N-ribohydrolase
MQARGETLAPGIIFDSDMGRNIDAALALAMLYGLGRGRLIAVGVHSSSLDAAAFCDAVARFYFGNGVGLPIGLPENGPKLDDAPMLTVPLGMRNSEGQPAFRHVIRGVSDTADPAVVFRNALLTQQDKQGIALLAGPATNFTRTLLLNRARDIVTSKVRLLVTAAGAFRSGAADPRIRADVAAARKLLAEWPSPIVAVGLEAGDAVPFPDESIETDFASQPNHPVVAAYRAYRAAQAPEGAGPGGVPTQAVLAALYATNPNANYFSLSPPGTIEVSDDGHTRFKESAGGNHRYLILDSAQKESIKRAFVALATARPPTGRGGPPRN